MCSISMGINTRELGNACKNCESCKHSDYLDEDIMVCFYVENMPAAISPCHVCHKWKGKL